MSVKFGNSLPNDDRNGIGAISHRSSTTPRPNTSSWPS